MFARLVQLRPVAGASAQRRLAGDGKRRRDVRGATLLLWRGDVPDEGNRRAGGGKVVAEVALSTPRFIEVDGPLGKTRIEVQPGRARVASDPGPRQYCVRQGWLTRGGAVAICAPTMFSLTLTGRRMTTTPSVTGLPVRRRPSRGAARHRGDRADGRRTAIPLPLPGSSPGW